MVKRTLIKELKELETTQFNQNVWPDNIIILGFSFGWGPMNFDKESLKIILLFESYEEFN